eukprot:2422-Pyramimonas_sp.AAC.1
MAKCDGQTPPGPQMLEPAPEAAARSAATPSQHWRNVPVAVCAPGTPVTSSLSARGRARSRPPPPHPRAPARPLDRGAPSAERRR